MSDTFIGMIRNIDLLYGFIYECTHLINNLYEHNNYGNLVKQLCSEFVLPIIDITKNEHIKEYNTHIKDTKDIDSICSYLMNICSERYFKLSQDEYSKIKKFMDNNICIIAHEIVTIKKIIENVYVLLVNIINFVKIVLF